MERTVRIVGREELRARRTVGIGVIERRSVKTQTDIDVHFRVWCERVIDVNRRILTRRHRRLVKFRDGLRRKTVLRQIAARQEVKDFRIRRERANWTKVEQTKAVVVE